MKISGFTFVRNADKLYIPVKESILSILPLCDEFVIALGNNDPDDQTEALIDSIASDKIKIVRTQWNSEKYPRNTEYARQTDIAMKHCSGNWLFYMQSDEAVHEKDHNEIKEAMKRYADDERVEGFLFNYKHFWGDYWHVHNSHSWYKKEMRIIRNKPGIHSWKDAQSFRMYETFAEDDYREYQRSEGTRKLRVVQLKASVYHYGYARPPHVMSGKRKKTFATYHGAEKSRKMLSDLKDNFDYGPLDRVPKFTGTHPAVMQAWIKRFDWAGQLQKSGKPRTDRKPHAHEKLKYRVLSWVENNVMNGKTLFDFQNYELINP
jgi:hypothetical protein